MSPACFLRRMGDIISCPTCHWPTFGSARRDWRPEDRRPGRAINLTATGDSLVLGIRRLEPDGMIRPGRSQAHGTGSPGGADFAGYAVPRPLKSFVRQVEKIKSGGRPG